MQPIYLYQEAVTPEMLKQAVADQHNLKMGVFGTKIIRRKVVVDRKGRRYEHQFHATKGPRKYRVY